MPPFDINGGARLDSGSTAKLRTLVSYLEVIAKLRSFDMSTPTAIPCGRRSTPTPRTAGPSRYLLCAEDRVAGGDHGRGRWNDRYLAANPGDLRFTGGGAASFGNRPPRGTAARRRIRTRCHSTSTVVIRIMRDVVRRSIVRDARLGRAQVLEFDSEDPSPQGGHLEALRRSANRACLPIASAQIIAAQTAGQRSKPSCCRACVPLSRRLLRRYLAQHPSGRDRHQCASPQPCDRPPGAVDDRDETPQAGSSMAYSMDQFNLADQGCIASIPSAQLAGGPCQCHPEPDYASACSMPAQRSQSVYGWIVPCPSQTCRTSRIRSLLEVEAFLRNPPQMAAISVIRSMPSPSYATAISSATAGRARQARSVSSEQGRAPPGDASAELVSPGGTPFETRTVQSPGKRAGTAELTRWCAMRSSGWRSSAQAHLGQLRFGRGRAARYRQQDRHQRPPFPRSMAAAGVSCRRE